MKFTLPVVFTFVAILHSVTSVVGSNLRPGRLMQQQQTQNTLNMPGVTSVAVIIISGQDGSVISSTTYTNGGVGLNGDGLALEANVPDKPKPNCAAGLTAEWEEGFNMWFCTLPGYEANIGLGNDDKTDNKPNKKPDSNDKDNRSPDNGITGLPQLCPAGEISMFRPGLHEWFCYKRPTSP